MRNGVRPTTEEWDASGEAERMAVRANRGRGGWSWMVTVPAHNAPGVEGTDIGEDGEEIPAGLTLSFGAVFLFQERGCDGLQ